MALVVGCLLLPCDCTSRYVELLRAGRDLVERRVAGMGDGSGFGCLVVRRNLRLRELL